uniref:Reverse transcriptase domain-containing protein n=1 Tax=Gadus morhua TaxID=8049 RepID=A0A8C5B8I2_GADMO
MVFLSLLMKSVPSLFPTTPQFCSLCQSHAQVVKDISSSFIPASILPPPIPSSVFTQFSPLTSDEVNRIITSNHATTCPLDAIPSSLLQDVSSDILSFLTSIINSSLTSGIAPASFKTSRIKPLLKKTTLNPTDIQNYRPVSLLSFLSKTLERAVANQLSPYLSSNHLLDPHQLGFKKAHSTETALLAVTESLCAARASSLSSVLILLDLSAAFDTVNQQILLATLAELGIAESALSWFTSYLTNRTYQVTWNGSLSKPCMLETGVPQGSVPGPLLFSLYTRSLGSVIASHGFSYHCYADDTLLSLLFFSFPSFDKALIATRISECLADVSTWTTAHHLRLNLNKTELLLIQGIRVIAHTWIYWSP